MQTAPPRLLSDLTARFISRLGLMPICIPPSLAYAAEHRFFLVAVYWWDSTVLVTVPHHKPHNEGLDHRVWER